MHFQTETKQNTQNWIEIKEIKQQSMNDNDKSDVIKIGISCSQPHEILIFDWCEYESNIFGQYVIC